MIKHVKAIPADDVKIGMEVKVSPVFSDDTNIKYVRDETSNHVMWRPDKRFEGAKYVTNISRGTFVEVGHNWYYPRQALLVKGIDYE